MNFTLPTLIWQWLLTVRRSYDGFANFFLVQAEEERFHAMKLYNYINDRGERAIITGFDNPNNEYDSVLNAFEVALEHEREVTKRITTYLISLGMSVNTQQLHS